MSHPSSFLRFSVAAAALLVIALVAVGCGSSSSGGGGGTKIALLLPENETPRYENFALLETHIFSRVFSNLQ